MQSHGGSYTNQVATLKEGLTQRPGIAPGGHGGPVPKEGRRGRMGTGRALETGRGAKTLTVLRAGALILE
jgi:hypothetical protein